jgi:hypothetical protein
VVLKYLHSNFGRTACVSMNGKTRAGSVSNAAAMESLVATGELLLES